MSLRRHFFFDLEDTLIAPVFQWSSSETLSHSLLADIPRPLGFQPLSPPTPLSPLHSLSPVSLARLLMECSVHEHPFISFNSNNLQRLASPFRRMIPVEFRLFSFALHHSEDLSQFHHHLAPTLFHELGFTPLMEPTVDSILRICAQRKNFHSTTLTFSDMIDFWGKEGAFCLWIEDFLIRQQSHWASSDGSEADSHQIFFIDDSLVAGCRRFSHFNADVFFLHPQDIPLFLTHPLTLFPDHTRIFHGA